MQYTYGFLEVVLSAELVVLSLCTENAVFRLKDLLCNQISTEENKTCPKS